MGAQKVNLRVAGWFGERDIDLAFPSTWEVTECRMAGHDKPALTDEEMRIALRNPFGTPRLSELAKGRKKAVILFDDLPKPTPTSRIIPFVLEEMHAGGITDDQIRFVNAPGTHMNMTYEELAVKLGADIVEKYPVYQHNVYENLIDLGTTSNGTPVLVNREYMSCDLRVGIGCIIPHQKAGFGAGGKIVIPGIAGMKTVAYHHGKIGGDKVKVGRVDDNPYRLDIEEAARLAGLQFKVDCVLNNRREVVGLFTGDFVAEHRAGVELARTIYSTKMLKNMDVLVNNNYPDESQFKRSTWTVPISLREGGAPVLWAVRN
jgi:nickel-dependent lactate racemase